MPARFAPFPPPTICRLGARTPKLVAHSAPEYVVGTETTGRPVAAEAAFAVSIAEPPPTASSESASGGTSIRCDGTSAQCPTCGSSYPDQRLLATSSGRSTPTSASTAGSSASDQRTIKPPAPSSPARSGQLLPREVDER